VDGTLLVGTGIGVRTGDTTDASDFTSRIPSALVALCAPTAPGCVPSDTSPPSTGIVAPEDREKLSKTAVLEATAADNVGVTWVEFRATGGALTDRMIGAAVRTPTGWTHAWNTTAVPNGKYTIESIAFDRRGNAARSPGVSVRVSNHAPKTKIVLPPHGSTLSRTALLDADASEGVTKVEFRVTGGALRDAVIGTAKPTIYGWIFFWDTTTVPDGRYILKSVASTGAGLVRKSTGLSLEVQNLSP
jgi:hypothetical protein